MSTARRVADDSAWLWRRIRPLIPEAVGSQVLIASVVVGLIVGVLVALVEFIVIEVVLHAVLHWPFWIQATAPAVGLLASWAILRYVGGGVSAATSEEYIQQFHSPNPKFSFREVRARLSAGVATIGTGGALGLEGPSVYLGSAVGRWVHQPLERRLGRRAAQQLLTAGAAAGVAAVFQAPATGVIFALESPYRDDFAHRAVLPSLLASAAAFLSFRAIPFVTAQAPVALAYDRAVGGGELVGAVLLGVGAGLGGRLYAWLVRNAKNLGKDQHPLLRVLIGGLVLGLMAVLAREIFGDPLTLGPGTAVFEWVNTAESLRLIVLLFFLRALATLTTLSAGGVGGLFIPLAVQGVLLGRIVGDGLSRVGLGAAEDARLWPILGLAAFLGAGYRTPIAAVVFVAESTAGAAVVPALIAAAVSQLVAGSSSVSAAQRVERLGHVESRLTIPIRSVIETDVLSVPPDATVSEFVWHHVIGQRNPVVPVVDGDNYLGLCSIQNASAIEREGWDDVLVGHIVDGTAPVARPWWSLRDAIEAMEQNGLELLAVIDNEYRFAGLIRDSEIVKLDEILDETEAAKGSD